MTTEHSEQLSIMADQMRRVGASIEELNARIARLAIALGVPLDGQESVVRAMELAATKSQTGRPDGLPDRRQARGGAFSGQDRRQTHKWVELRGLMVLRYGLERQTVEAYGIETARQLVNDAERRLKAEGFKPGSDGMNLRDFD